MRLIKTSFHFFFREGTKTSTYSFKYHSLFLIPHAYWHTFHLTPLRQGKANQGYPTTTAKCKLFLDERTKKAKDVWNTKPKMFGIQFFFSMNGTETSFYSSKTPFLLLVPHAHWHTGHLTPPRQGKADEGYPTTSANCILG